ncbi:hypothetical protein LOTGIDRAFT_153587 [Lottia gigantea]|uniref:Uncharacterized protein n=1 Tax=Lottia gigantea TaxID=225164 RepID=V4A364_LOTGI|nr:hypothetical protein LOTGIDRAFT_153587 [Lottia gigantea]ESO91157.1 hypothetical protein LOTGIDRAFT_153587 [Lottia gigantea]
MPKEILVLDRAGCSLPVSRGRIQKALTETDDEDDDDDDDDLLDTAESRKLTKGKKLKAKKKEENLVQHIIDIGHAEDTDHSEDDTEGQRSNDQQEGSIGTEEIGESSNTQTNEVEPSVSIISDDIAPTMTDVEFEFRKKVEMPVTDKQLPKSLSRALLALARNQSFQKMPDKNFNVQDNILIQTCDIEAFLMPTPRRSGNSSFTTSSGNTAISSLFLSPETFREILKKQQKLYPFELNIDEQWEQFSENYDESYVEDLKYIYDFVHTHGVLGVPLFDLQEKMSKMVNYKNKLQTLVEANSNLTWQNCHEGDTISNRYTSTTPADTGP